MDLDLSEFYDAFFEECTEGLDMAESGLLQLASGEVDSETINAIFRAVHSIKGGAGTFGFVELSGFAHIAETVLDEVRDGVLEPTSAIIDTLLASIDCLKMMVERTQSEQPFDTDQVNGVTKTLEKILEESPGQGGGDAPAAEADADPEDAESAERGWQISFAPAEEFFRVVEN